MVASKVGNPPGAVPTLAQRSARSSLERNALSWRSLVSHQGPKIGSVVALPPSIASNRVWSFRGRPQRGPPRLPRARHAALRGHLGRPAPPRPPLHGDRPLDGDLPRPRHPARRPRLHLPRRRPSQPPRPPPPRELNKVNLCPFTTGRSRL